MRKNPTQSVVEYSHAGVGYELAFDFDAVATAEDITGRPLLTGLTRKDVDTPTISLVRAMFFACLLPRQPQTTFAEAKALVTRETLQAVWGKTLDAWVASLPEPVEAAPGENPTGGQS